MSSESPVRVVILRYEGSEQTASPEHADELKEQIAELIQGWFWFGERPDLPITITFEERPQAELDALTELGRPLWA